MKAYHTNMPTIQCSHPAQKLKLMSKLYWPGIRLKKQRALGSQGAFCDTLVCRLMCFQGVSQYDARNAQLHTRYVFSRRHFHDLKKAAEKLFQKGNSLYDKHLYREAAKNWRWATQLQHGPSHASLATLLFDGGTEVRADMKVETAMKEAFEAACAGAALDCQDSKGALARCLICGGGIPEDVVRGLALAKESAATGSSFGLFAYGMYFFVGKGVAYDEAETVRLWSLAAAQGNTKAASLLRYVFGIEIEQVAPDKAEAIRN